jgi:thymidylate kinase
MKNQVIILTGPPGAGKSTIGKILASKLEKSAIVSADDMRDMVKNGRAEVCGKGWEEQLLLGEKNAVCLTRNFYESGFNVILDDVLLNSKFEFYYKNLNNCNLKIFLLMPNKEVLAKRDLERGECAMKERSTFLHDKFSEFVKKEKRFIVIDSSKQTKEETAEEIMKIIAEKAKKNG